jgi:hypothetical protein
MGFYLGLLSAQMQHKFFLEFHPFNASTLLTIETIVILFHSNHLIAKITVQTPSPAHSSTV